MADDIFDFGFTSVDVDSLKKREVDALEQANEDLNKARGKITGLRNLVWPLLVELKKNTGSDYFHWPNKSARITEFMEKIDKYIKED
jgi:hypothetical protein